MRRASSASPPPALSVPCWREEQDQSGYTAQYTPPDVENIFSLAPGTSESRTVSLTQTTTMVVSGVPQNSITSSSMQTTVQYLGQELVTVPAGTFTACKYVTTNAVGGTSSSVTDWYIAGSGVQIREDYPDGGGTMQATSITIDGQAVH